MNRRDFIRMAGMAGLATLSPLPWNLLNATESDPTHPFWILIDANGGWDPTQMCDPKGRQSESEESPINLFSTSDIDQVGNIQYAPKANNQAFFEKYGSQLCVVNGINTSTNNHDVGVRFTWSGLLRDGYPNFGALLAGALAPSLPMSFLINGGGYGETNGIVAPSRYASANAIREMGAPNTILTTADDVYHSTTTADRIEQARVARRQRLLAQKKLPRAQAALGELIVAHTGKAEMKRLFEFLPSDWDPYVDERNPLRSQIEFALAAYKAGLSSSVQMVLNGFDTHAYHDRDHEPLMQTLQEGIDFVMEEADRQGVADNIVVVMGSDFGRTPHYNAQEGKDHWPVTSMMFMGKGITGNRVVGLTDDGHNVIRVNAETLAKDENGIELTPSHIHQALRVLAGIENHALSQKYPLNVETLNLFG